jgi:hypothetical protein
MARSPGRLEAGAERRAKLPLFVVSPLRVVRIEPDAGPEAYTQPDRPHRLTGALEIRAPACPDEEAATDSALAPNGKHPTKAVPKVDRVQVEVHSKGQAIGRQDGKAQPSLSWQGVFGAPDLAERGGSQILPGQADPQRCQIRHHPYIEVESAVTGRLEVPGARQSIPHGRS